MIESGVAPVTGVYVRNKKGFGRWDDSGVHDHYRIHFMKYNVLLRYTEGGNPDYSKGPAQDVVVQTFLTMLRRSMLHGSGRRCGSES